MKDLIDALNLSSSDILNAVIAAAIFVLAAVVLDIFLGKVLRRFARLTNTDLDNQLIDVVRRPIFLTVILIGSLVAVSLLKTGDKFHHFADALVYSLITLMWVVLAIKESNMIIEYTLSKVSDATGLQKSMIPLVKNVALIALVALGIYILLSIWKINVTPLLASAGIAGAIIALAAKDTVANFFGGLSIFIDRPFKIGDYIVLDGQERGEVVAIGIRSTRIKTRDDVLITVPNAAIANSKIINESAPVPKFRVRIPIGVAYGSDIDIVQDALLNVAVTNHNVSEAPEPRVRFRAFGESSLDFELLCWVDEPAVRGLTIHELNTAIYKEFDKRGLKIPFPQRDVHISGTSVSDNRQNLQQ